MWGPFEFGLMLVFTAVGQDSVAKAVRAGVSVACDLVQPRHKVALVLFWLSVAMVFVFLLALGIFAVVAGAPLVPLFFTLPCTFLLLRLVGRRQRASQVTVASVTPGAGGAAAEHPAAAPEVEPVALDLAPAASFWPAAFLATLGTLLSALASDWLAVAKTALLDRFACFGMLRSGQLPDLLQLRIVGWVLSGLGVIYAVRAVKARRASVEPA